MPGNEQEFWFVLQLNTQNATRSLQQFTTQLHQTSGSIGEVSQNLEKVGEVASKQQAGLQGFVSSLQSHISTINRLSLVATGVFTGVALTVRNWVGEATNMMKVNQQLAAAMRIAGEYSEEQFRSLVNLAGQMQELTGQSDEAVKSAMALGYQFGLTTEQIKKIMPLLADMVATGKTDFPGAMQIIGMALQGQTRSLKQFGIQLKAVTGDAESYEIQIAQVEEKMREMEKTGQTNTLEYRKLAYQLEQLQQKYKQASDKGAILNEIMEKATRISGLASEISSTYAVRVDALKQKWGDFKEQLGTQLIPVFEEWVKRLDSVVTYLNAMDPEKIRGITNAVLGVGGLAGTVIVLGAVANGILAINTALTTLFASKAFATLSAIATSTGWGPLIALAMAVAGLGVGIKEFAQNWENPTPLWERVQESKERQLATKAMGERWSAMAEAYLKQQEKEKEKQQQQAPIIQNNTYNITNPNPSAVANAIATTLNRSQVGSTATRTVITRANPSGCP